MTAGRNSLTGALAAQQPSCDFLAPFLAPPCARTIFRMGALQSLLTSDTAAPRGGMAFNRGKRLCFACAILAPALRQNLVCESLGRPGKLLPPSIESAFLSPQELACDLLAPNLAPPCARAHFSSPEQMLAPTKRKSLCMGVVARRQICE